MKNKHLNEQAKFDQLKYIDKPDNYQYKIIWNTFINLIVIHVLSIYGIYYAITVAKVQSIIWITFVGTFSAFGVLAGCHRLWCHRSYKARTPLRILLMIMATVAQQNNILEWCENHRVHHKHSETDADPYNAKRGFWFAQILWIMYEKHPKYIEKCNEIDLSDIKNDPVIKFHLKYYAWLVLLFWGIIPTIVPWCLWSESLWLSFTLNILRYVLTLHQTGLVNSAAHLWGIKPYDKNIDPVENYTVTYFSLGEGYHNYHHTFPYDYSASEYGWASNFNLATAFIDFFERIGQVYDKKVADNSVVNSRKLRTGDHSLKVRKNNFMDQIFGLMVAFSWIWITLLLRYTMGIFF